VVGDHLRPVAQPRRVADDGDLAAGRGEEPVHRDALRQVREPAGRLLDVPRVDVEHAMRRLLANALDERGHAREAVDAPMDVVRVQQRDAQGADGSSCRPSA
jgi:hypothetical protein